jgi:chaperonin GroES
MPNVVSPEQQIPADPQAAKMAEIEQESALAQINAYVESTNIAELLEPTELSQIAERVIQEYKIDIGSRSDWEKTLEDAISLAKLIAQEKTYAGEAVANVKFPMIVDACIRFAARAYPSIVKGDEVVKPKVIGKDPQGYKAARGQRVAQHMNFQIIEEMDGWDADTDRLLSVLPLLGTMFRKTSYGAEAGHPQSEIVFPDDLVVNYHAKHMEPRHTHRFELYPNEIIERIRDGRFLDFKPGDPVTSIDGDRRLSVDDQDSPHLFLEQHRWLDLDDDGYKEPYIVTVHYDTEKVVRITARFDIEDVKTNDAGEIVRIKPTTYFTKYTFIPALDGGFYDIGFGHLLRGLNESSNTVLNQLLDSGTKANRQGGFIGKGVRLSRTGESVQLKSGEWKYVDATGDDLRKAIVPAPNKEPSQALFNLLEFLVQTGKELGSVTEVLAGETPPANTPATSVLAIIEQGLKVFSAIYLRIHRSLRAEFKKIRRLNKLYLTDEQYQRVLDVPAGAWREDYLSEDLDIVPVSDAQSITDMQRMYRAQALMELRGQGLDDQAILKRYLQILQVEDIEELIPTEPPPPSVEERQMDLEERRFELEQQKQDVEILKIRADAIKAIADAESKEAGPQIQQYMDLIQEMEAKLNAQDQILNTIAGVENARRHNAGDVGGVEGAPGDLRSA